MPNLSLTIRLAALNDADDVWRLVQDFAPTFEPEREAFDTTFRSLVEAPQTLVLVAQQNGGSVGGYLLAHCRATFLANGPAAWVEEVMVAERARRQGVGQALMIEAESWAGSQGAAYVSLANRRPAIFILPVRMRMSRPSSRSPSIPGKGGECGTRRRMLTERQPMPHRPLPRLDRRRHLLRGQ